MSSVENKVVHMTFDNAKFERDVATTLATIEKLKGALDFSKVTKTFTTSLGDLSKLKMSVDTSSFSNSISDAIGSARKLQDNLNFGASTKSLGEFQSAAQKFHLDGMAGAISGIGGKFSALTVIGVTALATIVSKAVTAGLDIAKAITFAPVISGFQEMETNMNSIQTILANTQSKGSTLEDVNDALQQLNEYSDKTIYNFGQMAKNIGTFTAAGVDLDTSVNAIKGIANLAAISGSSSEQASTAMYQLSQAISSGTVRLMDWNSVNNAGMGGEIFKNALFETGKALGKFEDIPMSTTFAEWEKNGVSFRESLESGWLTSDVLTTTLQAFTGDLSTAQLTALGYTEQQAKEMEKLGKLGQASATEVKTLSQLLGTVKEAVGTGWADSFKIIFGDFNEAKTLFTGLNDAIGKVVKKSADSRNKLLQGWKDLGGRTKLIEALQNAFKGLGEILGAIKSAFQFVFPPVTAERLFELTEKFGEFTEKLRLSQDGLDRVKRLASAFFTAIDIGLAIIKRFSQMVVDLFNHFTGGGAGGKTIDFFDTLARTVQHLYNSLIAGGDLDAFFDKVTEKLITFGDALMHPMDSLMSLKDSFMGFFQDIDFGSLDGLTEAFQRVKDKVVEVIGSLDFGGFDLKIPDKIKEMFDSLGGTVDDHTTNSLAGGFDRVSGALDKVWDAFQKVKDIAGEVFDALKQVDDVLGWLWDKLVLIKDLGVTVFEGMWDVAKRLGEALSDGLNSEELENVLDILDTLALLMGGKGIQDIGAKGLGVNLAADLTGGNLPKIGGAFEQLGGTFYAFRSNLDVLTETLKTMQTQIKANALLDIAKALALLTGSVLVLSFINPEDIAKGLTAMAVGMAQLLGAVALLNLSAGRAGLGPSGSIQLAGLGASLILIATAMVILSGALVVLSALDPAQLASGLLTLETLIVEMATAANLLKGGSAASLIAAGVGMVGMAAAMVIMAGALKLFSMLSWEEIGKGLVVVSGSLVAIAYGIALMPTYSMPVIGAGLIAIAIALDVMSGALLIFASMSWKEIGKGITVLAASLLIISAAMQSMPVTSVLSGPALIAVATALTILGGAFKIFATMSWEDIGKSMTILLGSLLILSAALQSMTTAIPGAVALGIAAVALGAFITVLKGMSKLGFKDLAKGLLVMVIAIGGLAIAALLVEPAIPAIFLLGVALAALGVAFALFGVGAALLAESFKIIAVAGKAGIDVLMYAIDQLLVRLPDLVTVFIDSLVQIVQSIVDALPAMIEGFGKIIAALLEVLIENIPAAVKATIMFIEGILETIREVIPDIVKTGAAIIMALLHGIEDNITELVDTVATIVERFLEELARHIPELATAGANLIVAFLDGISDHIGEVVTAGIEILEQLLLGLAENVDDIVGAVGEIITTFIDSVGDLYTDIAQAGTDAFIQFMEGMGDDAQEIIRHAARLVGDLIDAIVESTIILAVRMAEALIALLNGLADAIDDHDDEIGAAARKLALAIVEGLVTAIGAKEIVKMIADAGWAIGKGLFNAAARAVGAKSPATEFIWLGEMAVAGLVKGINDNAKNSENAAAKLADKTLTSFQKSIAEIPKAIGSMDEFNPTITPVLDLTGVKTTASQISGMLGNTPIQATATIQSANTLSAETISAREQAIMEDVSKAPKEIKFEQNNYSPEALNTAKIYRQSRSLIELSKKELELI